MASGVLFAELHMRSGEREEASDLAGVATAPVLSLFKRQRGQLFTVVEPSLMGAEDVCHHLVETIEDEYFRGSSRSVITSLRHAIAAANERLRAENSRATPDRQLRVGLSCAVVRDSDVYVAQVAPANAFVLHDGTVKRIFSTYGVMPESSVNGTDKASDALGSRLDPQVNFGYSNLDEGDMVVLASGAYWKLIPDRYILDSARHMDPEVAAQELYNCYIAHTRRPTTSILVMRMSALPAKQRRAETRTENQQERSEERATQPELERTPSPAGLERYRRLSSAPERPAIPGREIPTPRTERHPLPQREIPPKAKPSLLERIRPKRKADSPLYPPGPALEPVGKPSIKLRQSWNHDWTERGERPGWIKPALALAVVAAVLVLLGTVGVNLWNSWQLGDPAALVKEAQDKRALAASAENQTTARALLGDSYALLTRAQKARDDESTRSQAETVLADIDRIDRTVRINQTRVMVDYSSVVEEKGDVTQLVLDANNLYVLDEGLDRIYKYIINPDGLGIQDPGKHSVLVRRGDKQDGAVIGDVLSLFWMPAGQLRSAPSLFALESGRSLLAYDPRIGLSRIEVAESQKWGAIQAVNGFAGGLYLLDTKLKGVFYYPPTKNGYESQPYTVVDSRSKVDLTKAVDIALDGNLYVLEGDGSVKRFTREGRPLDFAGEVPDGPVKGPRGLYASANTRSLYLLDSQGERILQFSQDGKLQRQFKAGGKDVSFQDMRDIYVDEAGRKLYVLGRKALFVFDMPPMQSES